MSETKTVEKTKWFTTKEASKEAGVKYSKIMAEIANGRIVAKKISDSSSYGYHYLIADYDLMAWVEDPKKVRCEPIPSKCKKERAATDSLDIDSLVKALVDEIQKILSQKSTQAYEKGFEDGKNATIKALQSITLESVQNLIAQ